MIIKDYLLLSEKDVASGMERPIRLPKSNVLQFILEDKSIISVRPSGTEPKIKFYFGVSERFNNVREFDGTELRLNEKIAGIIRAMKLK